MSTLKVLTYNIAHGRGLSLNQALLSKSALLKNLNFIAEIIKQENPDVVGLQEIDSPSIWSRNLDQVKILAGLIDFPFYFSANHSNLNIGDYRINYGTALLSKFNFSSTHSLPFVLNKLDTKGLVTAKIRIPAFNNNEVYFASLHLDFLRKKIRREQITSAIKFLTKVNHPLIVFGDFNCEWGPDKNCLQIFKEELDLEVYKPEEYLPTYPSTKPKKRFDWIIFSKVFKVIDYRTINVTASDHLPIVAKITYKPEDIKNFTSLADAK
ncbi:MAG TPA: endonuclease/exonuclease/phosphatase family protein [Ignavibacteriaceae bacterium]|jgi:endonuclease/exonuclease/phosphatase family metal-dependent hydrolase|nr:endonuclease/exonuclease/phosphatase family protein [Ignavibacterium sp.]HRN28029.1 endonuclease/exonuclease/phosphatase family protein [Ignavibacteriaceae bacterium]HRP91892.1 endonuclease/exonuclease/phosphatase family protein [Ignavibacteriaceae bacterium]HRQ55729.1 endonuclease/exonuclease/phosphatase family protein [Ignavibacteriaceae bacterium]